MATFLNSSCILDNLGRKRTSFKVKLDQPVANSCMKGRPSIEAMMCINDQCSC